MIYFEYDSSVVGPQYLEVVRAHGEYLKKNSGARANLEGHTDERGSREYNVALAQRRSDAVMQLLIAQGVSAAQLSSVSFGEEKACCLRQWRRSLGEESPRRGALRAVNERRQGGHGPAPACEPKRGRGSIT